jgi:hypothetical protein
MSERRCVVCSIGINWRNQNYKTCEAQQCRSELAARRGRLYRRRHHKPKSIACVICGSFFTRGPISAGRGTRSITCSDECSKENFKNYMKGFKKKLNEIRIAATYIRQSERTYKTPYELRLYNRKWRQMRIEKDSEYRQRERERMRNRVEQQKERCKQTKREWDRTQSATVTAVREILTHKENANAES